ncbi:hypothetical protein [Falsiroseomonas selenitidurans]|uniref:Uncharacterized protein n=1 Tax=Falsiroseomonas selenitidurans TaxID=2716335 RepID=A0ABX1E5Z6_9PROT|nr:hypothetical protein [Falsiroseomonas selenitidurans]NKC32203.1 hypothetical protein [Falsiroseomonas selenitidurans]
MPAPDARALLASRPVLPSRPPTAASPPAAPEAASGTRAADPLAPAAIEAAKAAITAGTTAPRLEEPADWLALARSLDSATTGWRALFLGGVVPDLVVAGGLSARRRALAPVLHVAEPDPGRFAAALGRLTEAGFTEAERRLLQAAVGSDPARLPPRAALAQDLVGLETAWDLLRIGPRGNLIALVASATALLGERVRWLMLQPSSRAQEHLAIRALAPGGWRLAAERPAALNLDTPGTALRTGVQLWRGPLA